MEGTEKCETLTRANVLAAVGSSFLMPPGTHLTAHPTALRESKGAGGLIRPNDHELRPRRADEGWEMLVKAANRLIFAPIALPRDNFQPNQIRHFFSYSKRLVKLTGKCGRSVFESMAEVLMRKCFAAQVHYAIRPSRRTQNDRPKLI